MTDTETNKKIVDEFTQGLFSEGDLEAADEYLSVELVIHDPGSAPASAGRGAAIGLGDELWAAVWAGGVPVCSVPVPRRLLALGECVGGHEESRDPAGWAGSTLWSSGQCRLRGTGACAAVSPARGFRIVLEEPIGDRRTKRHEATRREIVEAAWGLARENGLAGVSLRDLGKRVGMQAPSLYSYFPSKAAIYDAMFSEGTRAFLERLRALDVPRDPKRRLLSSARAFAEFCVEDPVRYQLLFQRTIPHFEPSAESYGTAITTLDLGRDLLAAAGITDAASLDLWTALLTGIVDQQLSNDPGGQRWTRLLPDAVDMFLAHRTKGRR